jgi:DNA excision repair protein ERCC-4
MDVWRSEPVELSCIWREDDGIVVPTLTIPPMHPPRHRLRVDFAEQNAELLDLARACADFDVQLERLTVGDYSIDDRVVVERKTYADFAASLVDGRLFPQAAALAQCPHRPVILLEGPTPPRLPDVHPHALKGAVISLAVMWRLPVLCARDPADSLSVLRDLAHQANVAGGVLKRYDRKPKRLAGRKLYMLQGLPGVGPELAHRLLQQFGSVERIITATEDALTQVRGVGRKKAAEIRGLVS